MMIAAPPSSIQKPGDAPFSQVAAPTISVTMPSEPMNGQRVPCGT